MRSLAAIVTLVCASPAVADPVCVLGIDRVTGDDAGALVVCTSGSCLQLASASAPPAPIQLPPESVPPAKIRRDAQRRPIACGGATCAPIGPALAAAAAHASQISVTSDATAVVLDVDLWDVAADAIVPIAKPPHAPMDTPVPHAMGKIIVATWRNCPDDYNCGQAIATIVDRHGAQIGAPFPDGRLAMVDGHHGAIIGLGRKLTAFDTDTGAQLGTIPLMPTVALSGLAIGKVADGVLGVAWDPNSTAWTVARVAIADGKPPRLTWARRIPVCEP